MSRGRIVVVAGTRPEFIKLGPIVAALHGRAMVTVIGTGQHSDLLTGTPADSDMSGRLTLRIPPTADWMAWVDEMQGELMMALANMTPIACVVVQGDTMTALAGARAAHALNLPLAHVEAGLRSHCLTDPFPEESIRVEITQLADTHYAPTATTRDNLLIDGVSERHIHVTGNSGVSALYRYAGHLLALPPLTPHRVILTLHRRELINQGHGHLTGLLDALFEAAAENSHIEFFWPLHPSMRTALGPLFDLTPPPNVFLVEPQPYLSLVVLLRNALGVITDSGGLTEEAATLGVPCVMLRHHTDRPEAVAAGCAELLPPTAVGMGAAVFNLLNAGMARRPSTCFGTPESACLIASHLASLT